MAIGKYQRQANFTQYSLLHPTSSYNPSDLDAELNSISLVISAIIDLISGITRTDGKLANRSVGSDTITPELYMAMIAVKGLTSQYVGEWTSGHQFNKWDLAFNGEQSFLCAEAHLSSPDINDDIAAFKWIPIGYSMSNIDAAVKSLSAVNSISSNGYTGTTAALSGLLSSVGYNGTTATFSGSVTANSYGGVTATLSGALSSDGYTGTTATLSGLLSGASATFTGALSSVGYTGTVATLSGRLTSDSVLSGDVLCTGQSGSGLGYASTAFSSVTQLTSKATGVTINAMSGEITTNAAALAAAAAVTFVVSNSGMQSNDVVILTTSSSLYSARPHNVATGQFSITLKNESTASRSDAVVINYVVIKGARAA